MGEMPRELLGDRDVRRKLQLFASHSGVDKALVRMVVTQLRALGYQVWLDEDEILPGERILTRVEQGLAKSDYLILFLSEASIQSAWVDEEWRIKYGEQMSDGRVRVVPVLMGDCEPPLALKGRLYVQGNGFRLGRRAALELDQGILQLSLRGVQPLRGVHAVGVKTADRILSEIALSLQELNGTSSRKSLDLLVAARTIAATQHDAGEPELSNVIYDSIISVAVGAREFWRTDPELAPQGETLRANLSSYLRRKASGSRRSSIQEGSWSARMLVDELIEYLQVRVHMAGFRLLLGELALGIVELRYNGISLLSEIRFAGSKQSDNAVTLQEPLLESLCLWALARLAVSLESIIGDMAAGPELETAALLRLCRGASSAIAQGGEGWDGQPVTSAIDIVAEIYGLSMLGFDAPSFAQFGRLGREYQQLVGLGAAAVFDAALTNRGFPRDAEYWSTLRLSADDERAALEVFETLATQPDVGPRLNQHGFRCLEVAGAPFLLMKGATLAVALDPERVEELIAAQCGEPIDVNDTSAARWLALSDWCNREHYAFEALEHARGQDTVPAQA